MKYGEDGNYEITFFVFDTESNSVKKIIQNWNGFPETIKDHFFKNGIEDGQSWYPGSVIQKIKFSTPRKTQTILSKHPQNVLSDVPF